MVDGELIFPHNEWMVRAKIPADKFLSLPNLNKQFDISSDLPSFVCSRGTSGLNFSFRDDKYRLKLSESLSGFIVERLNNNNQWSIVDPENIDFIGRTITTKGVMFASMDLLPDELGNRYSRADKKAFTIKIKHN
jgi:hypothetical protein